MSRRDFLRNIGATAAVGGLVAGSRSAAAQGAGPTLGYFDEPEGPVDERLARPWELTEEEWTEIIGRVRAGRTLKPASWPGGSPVGCEPDSLERAHRARRLSVQVA